MKDNILNLKMENGCCKELTINGVSIIENISCLNIKVDAGELPKITLEYIGKSTIEIIDTKAVIKK